MFLRVKVFLPTWTFLVPTKILTLRHCDYFDFQCLAFFFVKVWIKGVNLTWLLSYNMSQHRVWHVILQSMPAAMWFLSYHLDMYYHFERDLIHVKLALFIEVCDSHYNRVVAWVYSVSCLIAHSCSIWVSRNSGYGRLEMCLSFLLMCHLMKSLCWLTILSTYVSIICTKKLTYKNNKKL